MIGDDVGMMPKCSLRRCGRITVLEDAGGSLGMH